MTLIELFWPALLLMLALSLMLVPFGQEVVSRGIIFLDLAVGQWAALGAAVGMLWLDSEWGLWLGALLGALWAASVVRLLSMRMTQVALEAPIGLLYALALSVFMLVQANAGSQREVVAALVAYDVLFTSAEQALLSVFVALLVVLLWWRFAWLKTNGFYWMFALVCAFAVKMAGLLVVFALLLAPALLARSARSLVLWHVVLLAVALSWLGLLLAFSFDWPAGYTLVALLSLTALLVYAWGSHRSL
jgi:zinc/manganese transport system permease protein